jgi:hypothetical protein
VEYNLFLGMECVGPHTRGRAGPRLDLAGTEIWGTE